MPRALHAICAVALSALALSACASGPQRGPSGSAGGGAKVDVSSQAEAILFDARKKKGERNCGEAIPSYRVVASFGKGYDVAQSELGECLLEIADGNDADAGLLREEALLWLRRSAYAGNARAQLALADTLSGATPTASGITPNPVEGYGWALVYQDNAAHTLYGLPDLHPAAAAYFRTQMNDSAVTAAQSFAAGYKRVEMDVYIPPFSAGPQTRGQSGGPGGARPRRR